MRWLGCGLRTLGRGFQRPVASDAQHSSCQRLHKDAMTIAAHLKAPKTPRAVLVEMPGNLDSLHRPAAFVAWRRGGRDQLRSGHGVPRLGGLAEGADASARAVAVRSPIAGSS
jgi:hypothetical protein